MTRGVLFLTFGFAVLFLIACAANPAPTATLVPATAFVPVVPSALDYWRVGGIAGFNDSLKIDAKGHAFVTRRTAKSEFDVDDATLKKITAAFQTANFASIPEDSMPRGMPADAFTYTLTYQGHTVRIADSAVPKPMQPLLEMLNQIINSAK